MYTHTLKKLEKNTVEILVDIPKNTVEKEYAASFSILLLNLEVEGFRKGKVPAKIAEKHLKKETVYQELIRSLVPRIYQEIIKKEGLKPIVSPKIELLNAKENEDWQIKITLAEKPLIQLGKYKDAIKKIKSEQKKEDIWVPGKNPPSGAPKDLSEKEKSKKQQELLNTILSTILKETKCEISDLVIEEELNHRLSNLVTDIQKIGLTVEAYLKSKNLTQDQLRSKYKEEIEQTYKLEFILAELADRENIKVENQELEKLLSNITDAKERESAKANSYFYASVLRKQKTLDYLLGL
ncbi:hypothetical protein A3A46_01790 [Candidatus Roizmanbacteria bacterium RIFCSPLOWO2_01_FULL_37_13]|uniref:Trigger factor n=1 Tax=Candidatus Roizmanbacteria bacterium RIFCSPHIGHO2_02_FULL_38_11 TaxID=1802039 RepID=A0A1F7H1A4_9BACT|nr:MAG: hypothetical protein A3C25_05695 [Candidatus Roizmanbacteria bacterium RIFCSPHIGHO2_02_FULL_38_11]OGK42130.1 MAG: hypothetical protein A3A46_01790 [Candidatus Roizmanbacteria bacterium RIFCSPLOWO2_01_FULL_37_13]